METKWPISWRKRKCKKQQPKSKLSYQEAKTLIRNKRLADFKHRNGGNNPQQDTLRLLSRHEQTMILAKTWQTKSTPWNSPKPTPDGAVLHPDGTTHITSSYRTLKKKNTIIQVVFFFFCSENSFQYTCIARTRFMYRQSLTATFGFKMGSWCRKIFF